MRPATTGTSARALPPAAASSRAQGCAPAARSASSPRPIPGAGARGGVPRGLCAIGEFVLDEPELTRHRGQFINHECCYKVRAFPYGFFAHRRRAHRAVQLAVRPPSRRTLPAARSRTRIGRARPRRRSTPSWMAWAGSGSRPTGRWCSSPATRSATPRSRRRCSEQGRAYRCYCTPDELAAMRERARAEGRTTSYDGRCRDLDPAKAPADRARR